MTETRERILLAATNLIRERGYTATRIDDVCRAAGITKGAFFHYFKSKEHMGKEAADFFGAFADRLFSSAPFQQVEDPVQRLLAYIDFREHIIQGEAREFTCLLGTMVQETYATSETLREACQANIWAHAETLVPIIREAQEKHQISDLDPLDLALFTQSVLQGAFILAKAGNDPAIATRSVRHLRRYVNDLFERKNNDCN